MPVTRLGSVTGESYYTALGFEGFVDAVSGPRGYLTRKAARANVVLPAIEDVAAGDPVLAHLSADRWLVACPDCGRDFQYGWRSTPLYLCADCWNEAAGGRWRPVIFPREQEAIEVALVDVPRKERNWLPGWSVERALIEGGNQRAVSGAEFTQAIRGGR